MSIPSRPCDHPLWATFLSCCENGKCKFGHSHACKHIEEARDEYRQYGKGLELAIDKPETWEAIILLMRSFKGTALLQCEKANNE